MLWSSSSAISSSNARSRSLCSTEGSLASLGFSCWSVSSFLFCWPLSAGLKLTKKDRVSQKLPTYPCPKPTLTLTPCLGQNVGLGEGWVSSFPETGNPKAKKNTFHYETEICENPMKITWKYHEHHFISLSNPNSTRNARKRFNEFLWTPKSSMGKQITVTITHWLIRLTKQAFLISNMVYSGALRFNNETHLLVFA